VPLLLLSMGSYLTFVGVGLRIFTLPWAATLDDATTAIAARAIPAFVFQYLVECVVARWSGVVTMYTWHPHEVVQHHFAGAALLMPVLLLHAWYPAEWPHFVQHHTPLVAIAASGFLTGLNEGLFVLRSLVPPSMADSLVARKGQRVVTLCVLAVNMPIMLASCILSALPPQLQTLATCSFGQCAYFGGMRRAVSLISYAACSAFVLLVQLSYVTSNLRHLGVLAGEGIQPATYQDRTHAKEQTKTR